MSRILGDMTRSLCRYGHFLFLFVTLFMLVDSAASQRVPNPTETGSTNRYPSNLDSNLRMELALQQLGHTIRTRQNAGAGNLSVTGRNPERSTGVVVNSRRAISQAGVPARIYEDCDKVSSRNFVYQDSITMWTGTASVAADGHIVIPGEYERYYDTGSDIGGFCIKTDWEGNVIWAKLYDSVASATPHFLNYFHSLALQDGRILLAGRLTNNTTNQADFILTLLNSDGDIIWNRVYEHSLWQGFSGSGDAFGMNSMEEDPSTGSVFFTGNTWSSGPTITKVSLTDGDIEWSRTYSLPESGGSFGSVLESDRLILFNSYYVYATTFIHVSIINKQTGDISTIRTHTQTTTPLSPQVYAAAKVIKLNNGHYRLAGYTTRGYEAPYTGTQELYHLLLIDLDQQFNFVRAFGFKSNINSWASTTEIILFPDGQGIYSQQPSIDGAVTSRNIVLFKDDQIYHERRRSFPNQFFATRPTYLRMPDGGFFMTTHLVDNGAMINDGTKLDYYRMHASDTLNDCLGQLDSSVSLWAYQMYDHPSPIGTVREEGFRLSTQQTILAVNARMYPGPACEVVSNCDTLGLRIDENIICPGSEAILTITKNIACGSLVPLEWDSQFTDTPVRLTDSTYAFRFNNPGQSYIKASLLGCRFFQDSLLVTVLPERSNVDLGPDREICEGITIALNAGEGFSSYMWQDGSVDSVLSITEPGIYFVTAYTACGSRFSDTVVINAHPPIPLELGPDRTKCNNDTLVLTAPGGFINYQWNSSAGSDFWQDPTIIVQPENDLIFYLQAEKSPGCFAYDSIQVTVLRSSPINLGSDTRFCQGDSLILNAGPDFVNYNWNTGENSPEVTIKSSGSYAVTATAANGCSSSDTIQVMPLFPLPQVQLAPPQSICADESFTFDAGPQYVSYQWNTGSTASAITVNIPGTYFVDVVDNNGCKGSDTSAIIAIYPIPQGFLPPDTNICSYGFLDITPQREFESYNWSTGSGNATLRITQAGEYWLQVRDENNCKGTDSIVVLPKDCMTGFFVPKAFTPNADGLNDDFKPLLFGNIEHYRFTVFNRWGQIVFQSSTPGQGWDGRYKGKFESANVFVWTCQYRLAGGEDQSEKGSVMLIR